MLAPKEAIPDEVPVLVDAGVALPKLDASPDRATAVAGAVEAESCEP